MTIKVTYNVTDVYVTQDVSPVYINVSYSTGGGIGSVVWGGITGTLSDQTDLQSALNAKFDDPTGTTSQYLRGDGTLATFPAIPSGTVSSVGLTMPSAFSVANSPITTSGTLAVTGAGTSAQYIRGDGQLANFPDNQGGGSSVNYYLNGSVNQGTFGGDVYYEMSKTPVLGAGTNFTRTNGQGNGYIASFITDAGDPSLLNIPGGNWNLEFYFQASSTGGSPQFYAELYKVSSANVFTLVASGSTNPEGITNGTTIDQYYSAIPVPQTSLLVTDRLAVRIYVIPAGRTITLHTENSTLCEILTTFSTGLNALNGLTAQVQYFATGTSGTDFGISSATDTHTFNLPTASATNRGALSSADWTTFSGKVGGSGTSGQVAYWNGTSTQTGSNNLYWDYTNDRLGIGTNTPSVTLDINGITKIQNIRIDGSNLDNTFIGRNTWAANTGTYNSFIGSGAGNNNTSGYAGTFLGYNSGSLNTTGVANTFLGYQSGFINTTGTGNTFIGVDAGYKNVASNYSVIIGFHAGLHADVSENVLIGADTAQTNGFSGQGSVYVGYRTGFNATTANYNTLIGSLAGFAVTTGDNLILIGREAGQSINTGSDSTIIGYRAGFYQTSPDGNTMVGSLSGFSNTTGNSNSYIGKESAYSVTTGSNNTIFGYRSGYYLSTGSDNTFIGALSGSSGSQLTTATNSIAIGYNSFTTASNQVVIGNVSTTHNILYGNLSLGAITNTGQVLQVTGTTLLNGNVTFSSATGMTWDAANSRLGIGTNAPNRALDVRNPGIFIANVSGYSTVLHVENTGNTNEQNKNVAIFVGARGSSSPIGDNTNVGIWQKSNIVGNYANVTFYNSGGNDAAFFGTEFVNHNLAATSNFIIATASAAAPSVKFKLFNTGNLLLQNGGTFTDSGERLQVTGTMKVTDTSAFGTNTFTTKLNASFGTIGIQSYAVNNSWFGDNIYYNGTNFVRISAGYTGLFYFAGNEGQFRWGSSGAAGSSVTNSSSGGATTFKMNLDGTVAMGDMSNSVGVYTNAAFLLFGNSKNIGINTTTDVASAKLHISSTTQGFLPPRMTTTQKNAISSPAAGLVVYDTTLAKLCVYTTAWERITSI
jgi:hypothetical protein